MACVQMLLMKMTAKVLRLVSCNTVSVRSLIKFSLSIGGSREYPDELIDAIHNTK